MACRCAEEAAFHLARRNPEGPEFFHQQAVDVDTEGDIVNLPLSFKPPVDILLVGKGHTMLFTSVAKSVRRPAQARHGFYGVAAALLLWLTPLPAHAYIGPAIAFVSYLAGPIVAVLAAVAMLFAWPAWKLIQKLRDKPVPGADDKKPDAF